MSAQVFTNIEKALQRVLNSISGKPKIQFENDTEYTPVIGTKYWRTKNIGTTDDIVTVSRLHRHQGIFQVSVFAPKAGSNAVILTDLNAIYNAYNSMLSLYEGDIRVDIGATPRGPILVQDVWAQGTLSIYYSCYTH